MTYMAYISTLFCMVASSKMLAMQDSEGRRRRFSMPFLVSPNVSRFIHLIFVRLFVHWIHFKHVELEGCLALDVSFTSVFVLIQ